MRMYLITSGLMFLALALAHAARVFAEGAAPLSQPIFLVTTLLSLAMAIWAFRLFRR